ncbi:unnamed protein product [Penicillium camemberti]|uniref:Str. FM013 n=1 Tax=Penicillium camemberti (strain FM 013) TaxID=1429867 RepID=A0A0G4PV62_PENC3|nr:unnamed protein product [Penicillium camemberti]
MLRMPNLMLQLVQLTSRTLHCLDQLLCQLASYRVDSATRPPYPDISIATIYHAINSNVAEFEWACL